MKRYAEIGSPCRVPPSSLKQWVIFPPFKINDSWSLSNVSIHFIKSSSKPYRFRTDIKKKLLAESNAFYMSILIKSLSIWSESVISRISKVNLPPSFMNLLFT